MIRRTTCSNTSPMDPKQDRKDHELIETKGRNAKAFQGLSALYGGAALVMDHARVPTDSTASSDLQMSR